MKEQTKDRVPPVTDDVDIEVIPSAPQVAVSNSGICAQCGVALPEKRLVGRCPGCGALFMREVSEASLS